MGEPMKSLLDKDFQYVNADNTDLKKTFERIRQKLEDDKRKKEEEKHNRILRRIA